MEHPHLHTLVDAVDQVDLSPLNEDDRGAVESALAHLKQMSIDEQGHRAAGREREISLRERFETALRNEGINSGSVAEIGGAKNSFAAEMPDYDFTFLSLFTVAGDDRIIAADITDCDYLPDESFDAIYSQAVLEHVDRPWEAARNISRLLKPGGISFHSAPFSYFYHGAPDDFWRFTPGAFGVLFSDLEPLGGGFLSAGRRRDNRGKEANRVDADGGEQFAVDSFGGWRENWASYWYGRKNADYLSSYEDEKRHQAALDLVKGLTVYGWDEEAAIVEAARVLPNFDADHTGRVHAVETGSGMTFSEEEVRTMWKRRGRDGVRPSHARFKMPIVMGVIDPR